MSEWVSEWVSEWMIFCIEGQAKAGLKLGEMVPDSKLSSQISDGLTLALVLRYPSSVL